MSFLARIKKMLLGHNAVVLMYHRVGSIAIDPWDLAVSSENFEMHLALLKQKYNVVPVAELTRQINSGRIEKNTICITFDDGYQDNFINAMPLLKKFGCPATFYITTGYTNQDKLFWWDVLTAIFLLAPKLPAALQYKGFDFTLENNGEMNSGQLLLHKNWKWPSPAPTQRAAIYLAIWEYLKPLPVDELLKFIDFLIDWSGIKPQAPRESLPMTGEQLKELSAHQLFTLGVHTVNHPALGAQHSSVQKNELTGSRDYLYQHFNNYTDTVAYPYGHYNEETIHIMKNENFEAGFTTEERLVNNKSDIYRLGRFQVKNVDGIQLKEQLLKWSRQ